MANFTGPKRERRWQSEGRHRKHERARLFYDNGEHVDVSKCDWVKFRRADHKYTERLRKRGFRLMTRTIRRIVAKLPD